jgi:hypothetical protein
MADMTAFDPQWIAALALLAMALIISAGLPIAPEWRKRLRTAAIAAFVLAMIVAVVHIARWAISGGR